MSYIINIAVERRLAVVVGAGSVARRKALDLVEAGATVTVIAPAACSQIEGLAGASRITLVRRPYAPGDLRGACLAIAATDDEDLNVRISRDAQSLGIPVNVVDRPALCTFTVPATVRRGDLTVAIATEGRCPAFAGVLREEFSARLGPEYAELVRLMGDLRQQMIAHDWNGRRIREGVHRLYGSGILDAVRRSDAAAVAEVVRSCLGTDFRIAFGDAEQTV
jgi:precorrin-2 dehydrogenase/sirohydrochlorin ferrochelatase